MWHQKRLSNFFFAILFLLVSANLQAEIKWEVAALFFGQYEDSSFQESIDQNLQEISRITQSKFLKIKTFRAGSSIKLDSFLKNAFKDVDSKKMLIFYGHGLGSSGLKDLRTPEIKKLLNTQNIKLDILWFDACYLSNLEFLYEMKSFSHYTIASQEAEFSSGLPFESLSELPQYSSPEEGSVFLAKSFIESYSYLKNGIQRDFVSTSSATISVIKNSELNTITSEMKSISKILKSLPQETQNNLRAKLIKKYSMDKNDLVDLGHLLIELRLIVKDPAKDQVLTRLIRALNIDSVKRLKTNPRIKIYSPETSAIMVFGFNGWENGFKKEYIDNPLFSQILKADQFVIGMKDEYWPTKKFTGSYKILTPFAPGIMSFDYYFINDKQDTLLSEALTFSRTHDIVETNGELLLYSAYTQRVGSLAERYTGINITVFNSTPSMDYFESDFNKLTNWLTL